MNTAKHAFAPSAAALVTAAGFGGCHLAELDDSDAAAMEGD